MIAVMTALLSTLMCAHVVQCNCAPDGYMHATAVLPLSYQHMHVRACAWCNAIARQMGRHATAVLTALTSTHMHVRACAWCNAIARQIGMHAIAVLAALPSTHMRAHKVQCNCAADGYAGNSGAC